MHRPTIFGIALGCAACSALAEDVDKLKVDFDRFKQVKMVSWNAYPSIGETAASATSKPSTPAVSFSVQQHMTTNAFQGGVVLLVVNANGPSRYAGCHETDWLVDNKPLKPAVSEYKFNGKTSVAMFVNTLTLKQLNQVAHAKVVEYRICKDEFAMRDSDLARLNGVMEEARIR